MADVRLHKNMMARLISTEGPYLEAVLEIGGVQLHVMDEFSVDAESSPKPGDEFNFEFSNYINEKESWESIFSANPNKKIGLEQLSGWSYMCFGKITKINPVTIDCGLFQEDNVISTHDERVIGEYVAFRITRLGGYAI